MKNAFMLPVVFCLTVLAWTFILGLFTVMDSSLVLNALLDGHYTEFLQALGFGILDLFPFTVPFSFLFIFFYLMRHKTPWWLSVPVVLSLACLSVLVLIPLSWNISFSAEQVRTALEESLNKRIERILPAGIVRQSSDGLRSVWFFDDSEGTTGFPVVTLNTAHTQPEAAVTVYDSGRFDPKTGGLWHDGELIVSEAGGSDARHLSLRGSIPFLGGFHSIIEPVLTGWRSAASRGALSYYLEAGSLFLAILALWPISALTGWRLLNMLFSFAAFTALYYAYPAIHSGLFWQKVSAISPLAEYRPYIGPLCYAALACLALLSFGLPTLLRRRGRRRSGGRDV